MWNMQHVIGALDGKRIRTQCPSKAGALCYNHKSYFSLVLFFQQYVMQSMAATVTVEFYVTANWVNYFNKKECIFLLHHQFRVANLTHSLFIWQVMKMFPLKEQLVCLDPGQISEEREIFNYHLSRARRTLENTCGILAARWGIFHTPIKANVNHIQSFVQAAVALYNYLGQTENSVYIYQLKPRRTKFDFAVLLLLLLLIKKALPNKS